MGNQITDKVKEGTIGEILVQLRLLEFDVQAAPPIKDSGNDLIAIKSEVVKFIQVKTTKNNNWNLKNLPPIYHLIFLVKLESEGGKILFDKSKIYFISKGQSINEKKLLTEDSIREIWVN